VPKRLSLSDAEVLEKDPDGDCLVSCFLETDDPRPGGRAVENPAAVFALRCFLVHQLVEYRYTEVTPGGLTFEQLVPYGSTFIHRDAAGEHRHVINSFDDHIKYISIAHAWLTEVEILLFSRIRRRNIAVYKLVILGGLRRFEIASPRTCERSSLKI
jgi:hypothetical protein